MLQSESIFSMSKTMSSDYLRFNLQLVRAWRINNQKTFCKWKIDQIMLISDFHLAFPEYRKMSKWTRAAFKNTKSESLKNFNIIRASLHSNYKFLEDQKAAKFIKNRQIAVLTLRFLTKIMEMPWLFPMAKFRFTIKHDRMNDKTRHISVL